MIDVRGRIQSPAAQSTASPKAKAKAMRETEEAESDQTLHKQPPSLMSEKMAAAGEGHHPDPKSTNEDGKSGWVKKKIKGPSTKEYTCCICFNHGTTSSKRCDCGHQLCCTCEIHQSFNPELESNRKSRSRESEDRN